MSIGISLKKKSLARSSKLGIVTEIERIQIENIEMTKERLGAFVAIFISGRATNSSQFIYFDNVNLCAEGIRSVSKLVEVSSKLKCFCLSPQSD